MDGLRLTDYKSKSTEGTYLENGSLTNKPESKKQDRADLALPSKLS